LRTERGHSKGKRLNDSGKEANYQCDLYVVRGQPIALLRPIIVVGIDEDGGNIIIGFA
jgi:hypothetical protein